MPVRIVVEGGPYREVPRAFVTARARAMLRAVQMEDAELSIVLTGDDQIQNLNRLYRKKNRPTDVLAFAQREGAYGERAGRLLGDVVISVPTAQRQAQARAATLRAELTMLLAHGLLHLLGWDHQTAAEDRRMRRETARLCEAAEAASPPKGAPAGVKGRTRRLSKPPSRARSRSPSAR
jgi:probable rRNA maturation factor